MLQVRELQSMAAQLHKDVELPPLTPLDHECAALDTLLIALRQVQVSCLAVHVDACDGSGYACHLWNESLGLHQRHDLQ